MPVDMSQIPVGTQQALAAQRGAISTTDMEAVLAQLAQNPEQLAQAMQALGLNVTPDQLMQVAEDWQESAAEKAGGGSDQPAETEDQAEAAAGETPEQEAEEGDDAALPPNAQPTGYSPQASPVGSAGGPTPEGSPNAPGGPPMAAGSGGGGAGGGSGGGGNMDDIVSAMMMQRATGNPNAAVPRVGPRQAPGAGSGNRNFNVPRGPAQIPRSPTAAASQDPRMKGVISDIYRKNAAQAAGVNRAGAPAGPRTGGGSNY